MCHQELLGGDEQPRKLTADLSAVPAQLVAEDGRQAFVGLAAGDIFRVCITGDCENLTESFGPKIVASEDGADTLFGVKPLTGRTRTPLSKP